MESNGHWVSKVEPVEAPTLKELTEALNSFYENRFIIATQTFAPVQGLKNWAAIVYYKVPPTDSKTTG